jgi:Ca-activated chloride channel family protein
MRSSAHYQLGNMALEKEDWDGAIASYVESLKAWPEHANAKWNLELALERKAEEEEKEEEQEQGTEGTGGGEGTGDTGDPGSEDGQTGSGGTGEEGASGSQEQDPGDTGDDDPETGQDSPEHGDEKQEEAAAEPMDKQDIQKALEQLDAEDDFRLGKPVGRVPVPDKDW